MKQQLTVLLLLVAFAVPVSAQPGPVRTQIDNAIVNAAEKQRIRDGHFYAKCPVERRWVSAWFDGHPHMRLVGIDDTPRWYDFGRIKGPRGFWFDIATGTDIGPVSKLDKSLATAMRRALLTPIATPVGLYGDTIVYCLVENVKYDTLKFSQWLDLQCSLTIPWYRRNADGTLSMAFVTAEQEKSFRRRNLSDLHDNFIQSTVKPLEPYLVDFTWYSKSNFLLETRGVTLSENRFVCNQADATECLWIKNYDVLYVWENGFLRGVYNLMQMDDLNSSWSKAIPFARNIRTIPFSDRHHRALLDRCEDSIVSAYFASLSATGHPDTALLARYFNIYGKYNTRHSDEIENSIFTLAKADLKWAAYYLQTYDRKNGHHYAKIDDLAFAIVQRNFSQAQVYKDLFPTGKHLTEAEEILVFEKACRNYDSSLYLSQYPSGTYMPLFDQFMESEEQRLYLVATQIYEKNTAHDIEESMRSAVYPYLKQFPRGSHLSDINEAYYYGMAFHKKMAAIYTSRYPSGSERADRLRQLIDIQVEKKEARTLKRAQRQAEQISIQ